MNTPPSRRRVLFVLSLVVVGFPLVQSLFVPALPLVQRDFDATTGTTAATFTVSFVAAAVATPVLGSIADNHGPRGTLLATLSVFLAGSLLAFVAPSITVLLVARVMQGAGGAVLPLCFAVLRQHFSTSEAARGVAYLSGVLGLGSAFGLVASGALIHVGSYRLLFVVSVLQAAAGMVVAGLWLPHDRPTARVPLDWFGAALLAAGTGSLLLAVTQVTEWGVGSTSFLVVLGTSALLLAGWVRWEHRARRPLLPVLLLHDSLLARANLASLFTAPALVGFFILVPQLAQAPETTGYGFGATALGSGVLLLPMTVTMLGAGVLCGRLVLTHPPKGVVLAGSVSSLLGCLVLSGAYPVEPAVAVLGVLFGVGVGLVYGGLAALAVSSASLELAGTVSSTVACARLIGAAIGGQLATAVLAGDTIAGSGLPTGHAYAAAFLVLAACAGVGLVTVLALPSPGAT